MTKNILLQLFQINSQLRAILEFYKKTAKYILSLLKILKQHFSNKKHKIVFIKVDVN
jgi:hypothetical protein